MVPSQPFPTDLENRTDPKLNATEFNVIQSYSLTNKMPQVDVECHQRSRCRKIGLESPRRSKDSGVGLFAALFLGAETDVSQLIVSRCFQFPPTEATTFCSFG